MADPTKDVRIAAVVALGAVGGECAGLVLRLKARLGDKDPDVLSECLGGLLADDPVANLPIVSGFLEPRNPVACEAAALALGKSRLAEALDLLKDCWQMSRSPDLKQQVLLAIAILRRPNAIDYLAGLVASAEEEAAIAALSTLEVHTSDPRLHERIATLVRARGSPTLQSRFTRAFRSAEP